MDLFGDIFTGSHLSKKHFIYLIISIILFTGGWFISPPSFQNGDYLIQVNYYQNNQNFNFNFSITLGNYNEAQMNYTKKAVNTGNFTFLVSYYMYYNLKLSNTIKFEILSIGEQIEGFTNKNIYSTINHPAFKDKLPALISDSNTASFELVILYKAEIAMGLLIAISFLWLTEIIPLAASSLIIPVIIVLFKVTNTTSSLVYFADPIIFLFLAGFLMAEVMKKTKLDQLVAIKILSIIPPNAKILILALMSLSAFFSMFMSNTAAAAVIIPLAIKLIDNIESADPKFKKTVVLGIAYSATVGGIGSLIGTPPNLIAVELLHGYDSSIEISFLKWFIYGLPVVIFMVPIIFFYLNFRFKPKVKKSDLNKAKEICLDELGHIKKLTKDQLIVIIIFVITVLLWLTTELHGFSASIIAVMSAVAFYFTGQLDEGDFKKINWNALLTFGGGLTLGNLVLSTGLANYISYRFILLRGLNIFLVFVALGFIALVLTAFASNTASAAILVPIAMPLAIVLGINPIIAAILVAIISSVDFAFVIGTPPTMVAYSTGIFKIKEIFRIGIILDFIGLLLVVILSFLVYTPLLFLI